MQKKLKGFSVIELVLAAGLFSVFSLSIVLAILQGSSAGQSGIRAEVARQWAMEGLEAARAVRSQSFDLLSDTSGSGIRFEDGKWEFSGEQDEWEGYTRTVSVQPARHDEDGNIVAEEGDEDADLKLITSVVTKNNFSVEFSTYLSRREIVVAP